MSTLTTAEHSQFVKMLRVFGAALVTTALWEPGHEPLSADPAVPRRAARLLVELVGVAAARRLLEYERRRGGERLVPERALEDYRGDELEDERDVLRGLTGLAWLVGVAVAGDPEVQDTLGLWRA
jgi:hypothetical protein